VDNPNDILLSKWFQNTITDAEKEQLMQVYDLDSLRQSLNKQESLEFDLVPADELWSGIEGNLSDTNVVSEPVNTKSGSSKIKIQLLIAAIIILGALLLYLFRPVAGEININTKPAQQIQQIIAENVSVDLAPGSSLDYNEETWNESRLVELKGQAFFDVNKGDKFTVQTTLGNVEVLGTEFEVWERDDLLQVSCYEGMVKVTTDGGQSAEIKVGEKVSINSGRLSRVEKHKDQGPGFLNNRVSYDRIELSSLAKEIERFYNIPVILNGIDKQKTFSGILISDDIDKACSYIAETLDLKYETGKEKIEFHIQ